MLRHPVCPDRVERDRAHTGSARLFRVNARGLLATFPACPRTLGTRIAILEGVSEVLMPLSMGDPAGIICCEYGQRVSHRINTGGTPATGQTQILRDRQPTSSFRYNVVNVHAQPTVFFCRQAARATMRRRNAGGIGIGMSQRRYQEGQKRQVHDEPTPRRTTRKKPLWFPKLADRELQVVSP